MERAVRSSLESTWELEEELSYKLQYAPGNKDSPQSENGGRSF